MWLPQINIILDNLDTFANFAIKFTVTIIICLKIIGFKVYTKVLLVTYYYL